MATIVAVLLALWAVMLHAPSTPAARAIHHGLVVRPAVWLGRIGRGHVALLLVTLIVLPCVALIVGRDSVPLVGMALPELATWAATFEIATVIDLALAAMAAGSSLRFARWFRFAFRKGRDRQSG